MTRIILGPAEMTEITEITEIFFAGEKLGASHNHFLYFLYLTLSSDVTTWDSPCEHDSPLAAPSGLWDK